MLDEADHRRMPVFRVPLRTPFVPIVRIVAAANQDLAHRRLLTSLRIFDTLAPRAEPLSPGDRFRLIEGISGYRLHLVTAAGASLVDGFAPAPTHVTASLRDFPADGRSGRPAIPGGHAAPVWVRDRLAGFVVALEQEGATPAGLGVLRTVVTIAGLELTDLYREREVMRRKGSELLARLFAGQRDGLVLTEALEVNQLRRGVPVVVAAVEAGDDGDPTPALDDELHHRLADAGIGHLLLVEGRRVFVVLPATYDGLDRAAEELGVRIGVSAEHADVTACPIARKEAVWAVLQLPRDAPGTARFRAGAESMHWLPADLPALERLVELVLGPLIRHDAEHGASLVRSLTVFFAHDRRLKDAAEQLFVHKHTLAYRLKRIEGITGRDLAKVEHQSQLWLALQALDVVSGGGRS
jgi:purine catabolism regulator